MKANDVIIYTDMDGTLLTDRSMGPVVPERSLRQIRRFVEEGGCFGAASGREAPDILRYFPGIPLRAPLICSNGALVYDAVQGRVLRSIPLPKAYRRDCLDYVLSRRDLWIVAADQFGIYQVLTGDSARDVCPDNWERPFITMERFLTGDFTKVVYITASGEDMEALIADEARLPHSNLVVGAQSDPRYYEMVERSVSKGAGVRYAMEAAGLEGRTLVCIGDYFNDWTMLQTADIPACPDNSPQAIKDICQIVTCDHNEGAVGDLIERLHLW